MGRDIDWDERSKERNGKQPGDSETTQP